MIKIFLKPAVIGYLILLVGFGIAFQMASNSREEAKRQGCVSLLEAYDLVADVVDIAIPDTSVDQPPLDDALPQSIRDLIEESRVRSEEIRKRFEIRLNEPITLCEAVGIDRTVELGKGDGVRITYSSIPTPTVIIEQLEA